MSELDAIDTSYLAHEFPMRVCKWPPKGRGMGMLSALASHAGAIVLPAGYTIEILEPTLPHPFELARWADDGGRV